MRKNFFKKVALSLACAMVVTSVTPFTATAGAATVKLNATKKTLNVGKSFTFKVTGSKKTVKWSSSKSAVASVGAKGKVTAKSVGSTTIKAKVGTKTLKATVKVVDPIVSVKINNAPEKVGVGEKVFDLNRTFTTKSGATGTTKKQTNSITRWEVVDETNTAEATISTTGVVSTKKTGEFEVRAISFAKKADYKKYLEDTTANASLVLAASDSVKIAVPFEVEDAKLVAVNKVAITVNSPVENVVSNDIYIKNVATSLQNPVKEISYNDDKTIIYATTYSNFENGKKYELTYKDSTFEIDAVVGEATAIKIPEEQVCEPNQWYDIQYTVEDENGLDITNAFNSTINWEITKSAGDIVQDSAKKSKIKIPTEKTSVFVKATIPKYDDKGKDISIVSNQATITAVKPIASNITWTITDKSNVKDISFTDLVNYVAVNDPNKKIAIKYVDSYNKTKIAYGLGDNGADEKFSESFNAESVNETILGIDKFTGQLYPRKEGTAQIKLSNGNDKFIQIITVEVRGERKASTLFKEKDVIISKNLPEKKTVEFKVKDQYDQDMGFTSDKDVKVKKISGDDNLISVKLATGTSTINNPDGSSTAPYDAWIVNGNGIISANNSSVTKNTAEPVIGTAKGSSIKLEFRPANYNDVKTGTASYLVTYGGVSNVITVTVKDIDNASQILVDGLTDGKTIDAYTTGDDVVETFRVLSADSAGTAQNVLTNASYSVYDSNNNLVKIKGKFTVGSADYGNAVTYQGDGTKTYDNIKVSGAVTTGDKNEGSSTVAQGKIVFGTKNEELAAGTYTIKISVDGNVVKTFTYTVKSTRPQPKVQYASATQKITLTTSTTSGTAIGTVTGSSVNANGSKNVVLAAVQQATTVTLNGKTDITDIIGVEYQSLDTNKIENDKSGNVVVTKDSNGVDKVATGDVKVYINKLTIEDNSGFRYTIDTTGTEYSTITINLAEAK